MQVNSDRRTGTREGRSIIREGNATKHVAELGQPEITVDPAARRIVIRDRGETFGYEFGQRRGRGRSGGLGWSELTRGPDGAVYVSAASTAEVMAVCRDGCREGSVAAMTLAAVAELGDSRTERNQATRLMRELAAGIERERVSLRAIQARIVALLVEGAMLSDLAARGGFVDPRGRIDTTWLERRAGLMSDRCSRTGKVRTARTASYPTFCRLGAAVGGEPHEFDV